MEQPTVVIAYSVAHTPEMVSTPAVRRPIVDAIGQAASTIFLGGRFTRVAQAGGGAAVNRSHFVAFNANTGAFRQGAVPGYTDPVFDNRIWTIATHGDAVYVGGQFTTVNGVTRRALVKLDADTGAVDTSFNAGFGGGKVYKLQIWNDMLIVGGTPGRKLWALDLDTGARLPYFNDFRISNAIPEAWGGVAIYDFAIKPDGTKLIGVGNFRTVNDESRTRLFVANLGPTRATLDDWYYPGFAKPCETDQPRRVAYLVGVDFPPVGEHFFLAATGFHSRAGDLWPDGPNLPHTLCDAVGRFELDDDTRPTWINYTGGDSLFAVAATGAAVYVQGHNRWMSNPYGEDSAGPGAVNRRGLAAVDPETGDLLRWNPNKPAQIGGKAFLVTANGLWVGSDSIRFKGEPRRGIAFVPLP